MGAERDSHGNWWPRTRRVSATLRKVVEEIFPCQSGVCCLGNTQETGRGNPYNCRRPYIQSTARSRVTNPKPIVGVKKPLDSEEEEEDLFWTTEMMIGVRSGGRMEGNGKQKISQRGGAKTFSLLSLPPCPPDLPPPPPPRPQTAVGRKRGCVRSREEGGKHKENSLFRPSERSCSVWCPHTPDGCENSLVEQISGVLPRPEIVDIQCQTNGKTPGCSVKLPNIG